ncbi:MAG: hypothetical protein ACREEM_24555 [Blastocatellia bacterium]
MPVRGRDIIAGSKWKKFGIKEAAKEQKGKKAKPDFVFFALLALFAALLTPF